VALKTLPLAAVLDGRQLQRFKNEAQAAAALEHPNIIDVYAVGCERGVHYYAMSFVEGQTLAQVVAEVRSLQRSDQPPEEDRQRAMSEITRGFILGRARLRQSQRSLDLSI
jgi:serine/threonine protein kinase